MPCFFYLSKVPSMPREIIIKYLRKTCYCDLTVENNGGLGRSWIGIKSVDGPVHDAGEQ